MVAGHPRTREARNGTNGDGWTLVDWLRSEVRMCVCAWVRRLGTPPNGGGWGATDGAGNLQDLDVEGRLEM